MATVSQEVGKRIRSFRKAKKQTLAQMSTIICKSQSTISKYETGEISVDIDTLYDIADALHIHVEQLLCVRNLPNDIESNMSHPAFFRDTSQFYMYVYDGRSGSIVRCILDILSPSESGARKVMMYMNFKEYSHYQNCENTYWGYIEHYDAITNISLTNQATTMEKASIQILASYLDADTKWGLFNGFSSRPMMPIAIKMLFSKTQLIEDEALIRQLKVTKEDVRILKHYNMLAVT